jgi:hypothetical protein
MPRAIRIVCHFTIRTHPPIACKGLKFFRCEWTKRLAVLPQIPVFCHYLAQSHPHLIVVDYPGYINQLQAKRQNIGVSGVEDRTTKLTRGGRW